ncbi:hypothetical protein [Geobacter sp. AOG2]|uniref:hypothetical protein n=1 Tax=Geobacter sp. AOG2 TaxID=1566347 RepID=UPI001CC597E4|nr:hypothetical protein [Geobacter sp. AOG2]
MFELIEYNWKIHRLLRQLAKQRVRGVLQPGNVWVLEFAVQDTEVNQALIYTCQLRGWVELLHESIPTGHLNSDGSFTMGMPFDSKKHIWKLTDSGWAAIQRRHEITIIGILITLIGVIAAVISIFKA